SCSELFEHRAQRGFGDRAPAQHARSRPGHVDDRARQTRWSSLAPLMVFARFRLAARTPLMVFARFRLAARTPLMVFARLRLAARNLRSLRATCGPFGLRAVGDHAPGGGIAAHAER